MPKREINYPYNATKCYILDRYANKRAEFDLLFGINELEILPSDFYYQTKDGLKFYLHKGEGVLDFSEAQKEYDFKLVDSSKIDNALFFGTQKGLNSQERDFLAVLEINLQKGQDYLTPRFFNKIEREILQIKECQC